MLVVSACCNLVVNRFDGSVNVVFEIGGGLGSAAMGVVVDRAFGGRWLRPVLASAVASGAALWLFVTTAAGGSAYVHGAFLLLAGAANCGADTLLSGSIPARLGESGGRYALDSIWSSVSFD